MARIWVETDVVIDVFLLKVKVVPGASRDAVVGPLGDALKVRVAAPPEGGKANQAVIRLLAAHFGVSPKQVRIVAGRTSALKTVEIDPRG